MRRKTAQERQLWWRRGDWKELPHVQGKEQWLHFAGAAVKRYPTSEIREAQVSYDQPRHHIKKQRHYFANKSPSSQGYGFPSGHVWMWELDCEESWAPKKWCFWTVVLQKTLESPLDCKEIQPVHSEGDQSWVFIGTTDAKAETPILGHLMRRFDSLEKTLMLGGIGGRRRRGRHRMRWMASPTQWAWVWVNSGSWWWTGRPGVLQFMGSQRVGHDWVTELNWYFKYLIVLFANSVSKNTLLTSHCSRHLIYICWLLHSIKKKKELQYLLLLLLLSRSVVSNSYRPHRLQPTRLLRPWDFPGKSTGVGCHCLLWQYLLRQNGDFWCLNIT